MARKKPADDGGGGANWMDTYGDLVTLLLAFFVLLYAFSKMDAASFSRLASTFNRNYIAPIEVLEPGSAGMAGLDPNKTPEPEEGPEETVPPGEFDALYKAISDHVVDIGLGNAIEVSREDGKILMRVKDSVFFDTARDVIKPDGIPILESVADILNTYESAIKIITVEGHTDSRKISGTFDNNWFLGGARAARVVTFLVERTDIPDNKFTANSRGESMPIAPNDGPENWDKNRRVDFIIEGVE
ncbi:flagellar motor protein MotB [Clostridia bacterium OttesenSCG-928-F22]|nr:flagellar motor protein MotB [Clostridia bacterium OttesenSCG-928-F22]